MKPFKPFADPDVQAALQRLITVVSDVALRQGQTPYALIIAASAAEGQELGVDTVIFGATDVDMIEGMALRIIETAENADDAETFDLPRPN